MWNQTFEAPWNSPHRRVSSRSANPQDHWRSCLAKQCAPVRVRCRPWPTRMNLSPFSSTNFILSKNPTSGTHMDTWIFNTGITCIFRPRKDLSNFATGLTSWGGSFCTTSLYGVPGSFAEAKVSPKPMPQRVMSVMSKLSQCSPTWIESMIGDFTLSYPNSYFSGRVKSLKRVSKGVT